jgi:hypothetical protein
MLGSSMNNNVFNRTPMAPVESGYIEIVPANTLNKNRFKIVDPLLAKALSE